MLTKATRSTVTHIWEMYAYKKRVEGRRLHIVEPWIKDTPYHEHNTKEEQKKNKNTTTTTKTDKIISCPTLKRNLPIMDKICWSQDIPYM